MKYLLLRNSVSVTALISFCHVFNGLSVTNTQWDPGVWSKELSMTINGATWDTIWSFGKKLSICIWGRAIQFKILHRLHISPPQRLFFNSSLSAVCLKCKTDMGTLSHCFWSCHKLQRYGDEIICEMERIFHIIIEITPSPWTWCFQVNSSWKKTLIFSHLQWGKIFFCNGSLTRLLLHHFLCYVIFSFYSCKSCCVCIVMFIVFKDTICFVVWKTKTNKSNGKKNETLSYSHWLTSK